MRLALAFGIIAVVLGYLIAHPHVGTVYVEVLTLYDRETVAETGSSPIDQFLTRAECDRNAEKRTKISNDADTAVRMGNAILGKNTSLKTKDTYWCRGETRLLWGW